MAKRKSTDRPVAPVSSHAYPRPMLRRTEWTSLNGPWDFAIDVDGTLSSPASVEWKKNIIVPFAPETSMSGIEAAGFFQACWYRRSIDMVRDGSGRRFILHFGAVDWEATVWVNGRMVAQHEGGYTPFHCDITDALSDSGNQEIIVRATDDPHDVAKPRGKQDWEEQPHSIWYQRTTGIWQTVWLEIVHRSHIASLRWTPDVPSWSIQLDATIAGPKNVRLRIGVKLSCAGRTLSDDVYSIARGEVSRTISLNDPGTGAARFPMQWQPDRPTLIDAKITLLDEHDAILDVVESYTALRTVAVVNDRFILNEQSMTLRLALDQGYWPESGLTAPDDDAIRRDVELALAMGFNGVRKHQKIEQPRFLYWADKLGLMVWEELPSAYRFSTDAIKRSTATWTEAIRRDVSHPCIIAWVPFNESWGLTDLPVSKPQRDSMRALYSLTKAMDPTRPVISNDGWELGPTDLVTIHDYESDPRKIAERYAISARDYLLKHVQPAGKQLLLDEHPYAGQPILLSEFGGIAFSKDAAATWGYSRVATSDDLSFRYAQLLQTVRALPLLMGFCYTQFTDTYQEANGLLYMDRTPKFPIEEIAVATRGSRSDADRQIEAKWTKRSV